MAALEEHVLTRFPEWSLLRRNNPVELHNPVRFPCLSVIIGKCLLPFRGIRSDIRPNESDDNGPAIESVFREECAGFVLKCADDGWVECVRMAAVEPPNGP